MKPLRCWTSVRALAVAAVALLAGCAGSPLTGGSPEEAALARQLAAEPPLCQSYRTAWVAQFKVAVARLNSGHRAEAAADPNSELERLRPMLTGADIREGQCTRPYCVIEPLQEGKLDSWCGYRVPALAGQELYRWIAWDRM